MTFGAVKKAFSGKANTNMSDVRSALFTLGLPIFIEVLLVMTMGAVDTFMLSRYSDNSVAAVGVVNQIVMFCFLIFQVINIGTSVLCSQYFGAKQDDKVTTVVGVALLVNLVTGLTLSACLHFFRGTILGWMGLTGEVLAEGERYLNIVGAFAFFQAIAMTLSASLRSANKAVFPMLVTLIINILNIFGNYSLIFGKFGMPALGVEGAALSTAICRAVGMVILWFVVKRTLIPSFPLALFRPFPMRELQKLLRIGLPSAGENASYDASQIVITFFINMIGVSALITRSYCVNIIMFTYLLCIAISQAGSICIGNLVGRGKVKAAYLVGLFAMKRAVAITMVCSVAMALAGPFIFPLLTSDPEVIRMGCTILWIDVLLEIGRPINIFATSALRSAGDVNHPLYVGLVVMWSIAVGLGYTLGVAFGLGLIGMWAAFTLDENIRGIVFVLRWKSMKWANKGFVD